MTKTTIFDMVIFVLDVAKRVLGMITLYLYCELHWQFCYSWQRHLKDIVTLALGEVMILYDRHKKKISILKNQSWSEH